MSGLKKLMLATGVLTLSLQAQVITNTYTFTGGAQLFTVPNCVSQVTIECFGASGGSASGNGGSAVGGLGGYASGVLNVVGGNVLNIYVGGAATNHLGGYNGGGNAGTILTSTLASFARGGGGASDVRLNGTTPNDRVIVAGGGGGAGARGGEGNSPTPLTYLTGGNGGAGGGGAGANGADGAIVCKGGKGGTVNTGGVKGVGCTTGGVVGTDGTVPNGGSTSGCCNNTNPSGGGGGGGFLAGGGGGAGGVGDVGCNSNDEGGGGGGAGGSNYTGTLASPTTSTGVHNGNGQIIVKYTVNPISVSIASSSSVVCVGGQAATLTANGAPNYTWSTGATGSSIVISPTAQTTYSVIGSSAPNCSANSNITINVTTVSIVPSSTLICLGQSGTLTASGANTYTWNTGANGSSIVVTPTAQTTYSVSGSTSSNCDASSAITISVTCIGLKELSLDNTARVYPNPANDKFMLEGDNLEQAKLTLSNVEGRIIPVAFLRNKNTFEVDVKSLSPGAYFVLINRNGVTTVKKIMIE